MKARRLWLVPVVLLLIGLLGGIGVLWLQALTDTGDPDEGFLSPILELLEETGSVLVESTPPGATVRVNGREHCTTPCRIDRLALKTPHRLEVSKAGFRTFAYDFALEGTDPRRIPAPLEPLDIGSVSLTTDLPEASASLDGQPLRGGPPWRIAELSAGTHTLRVTAPGLPAWVREFKLEAGQRLTLEAKLEKPSDHHPQPAHYTFRSIPAGATFSLDGQELQENNLNLEPGQTYRLTASLPGFEEWTETLRPKPDDNRRLVARLKPAGDAPPPEDDDTRARLFLDAPAWATVFVDDKIIGPSPIDGYPVAAGQHTIRLANAELNAEITFTVVLKPGEEYHRKVQFNKGKLLVIAKPWAHVFIGNKMIGTTPMQPIELFEGKYKIRLENTTFGREEIKTVTITAGQTATIEADFLQ